MKRKLDVGAENPAAKKTNGASNGYDMKATAVNPYTGKLYSDRFY